MANKAIDGLAQITDRLEEVKDSLTGLRNMSAKRQLVGLIDDLDNLYNDFSEFELKIQSQEEIEQQLKERAIRNIIEELERREVKAYSLQEETNGRAKPHFYFNGELFLSDYLENLTQGQTFPLQDNDLVNYIWWLIAVDVAKFKEKKTSVLDLWTNDEPFTLRKAMKDDK